MSQIYTFHKSAIGKSHVMREKPCEDSSCSYVAEGGRYHIAVVADGHGQQKSFRSKVGSQAAVDVALECLKGFAEAALSTPELESRFYLDILTNPRYRQMTVRQLTNTILAGWSDRVRQDHQSNPPTPEELGVYADYFQEEGNLHEIYGTTLLAALRLPRCMLLLHQGDGRCDVFYEDGSVDQPIPWDSRCHGYQTTSLCDPDAADSFRHLVIDTDDKKVIACYLGSDGVEDAYRSQEGTHTFYRELSCQLVERYETDFDAYLERLLPQFSANGLFSKAGSLDDVSVAGIVDVDAMEKLVPVFRRDVQRYTLSEELFWLEDALRSKTRKHSILLERYRDSGRQLEQTVQFLQQLEVDQDALVSQLSELRERIAKTQQELDEDTSGYISFTDYFQEDRGPKDEEQRKILGIIRRLSPRSLQDFFTDISNAFSVKEAQYEQMLREQKELTECLCAKEAAIEKARAKIEALRPQAEQAKADFDEFDAIYQIICGDIASLQEKIRNLSADE